MSQQIEKKPKQNKPSYHHGDLRSTLLNAANVLLKETGIESLSLRKLADKVGVSRTAPYHHFKDKNQLLCAIAEQGFVHWQQDAELIFNQTGLRPKEQYRQFFHGYISYAADNPELYDLMFGRTIWKQNSATNALRDVAYPSFHYQVGMTKKWQQQGLMPSGEDTLRLSQVTWGTMHGIARLLIDGIYADRSHIDEMCDCAINLFTLQISV
ncbi:TetR/AcrR family transcriptional regulator [Paraglaciecola sp. MB-3u-78]|uniref:TetR/AcrR family transcriptional regulator n=1 Tax=Paraglaciecola sp. MB-3u-78 TaxID=2058332 RepID=UPI000C345AB3|nr:TetR/AcrR family transcriptional regulator [Paraglaciecola sp. MB-3u-78]PKH00581.1 TetR family transcriptional regulator [Paraglaciecola sp. MB-3u-78]